MSKSKAADWTSAERPVWEVVKVKPKLPWRSQDVGDARIMVAHALRKADVMVWIEAIKEVLCATGRRTIMARIFIC